MSVKLNKIIQFRSDRLFDGAVDVGWFIRDPKKCQKAAEAFVFHGPTYHGVSQEEVGTSHGHSLIDTASFVRSTVNCCDGSKDEPFNLAIAGYGTGKSHLALTIASLLSSPNSKTSKEILSNLESVDEMIGGEVRATLKEVKMPCLTVALNGMNNFDLAAEFTRQVIHQLNTFDIDTRAIDDLRPRFKNAANLLNISSEKDTKELINDCKVKTRSELIEKLQEHDETVYSKVQAFFAQKGIPLKAIGDETVKDVIDTVCREYCGEDKPFKHFLILFDEFGRYAEFATLQSQVAGSGVLQHLFEGVQSNAENVTFVGFIQFDLNAYVQRIAPEFKNEILRVSTRYQSANKSYLSINLETLIANLLEKLDKEKLNSIFDRNAEKNVSEEIAQQLRAWFPVSNNHYLWRDSSKFHTVIRKGCWPLSPYSVWFLFHLAAAGKHLQQRSALAYLGDAFSKYQNDNVDDISSWKINPVDLWSDDLENDLRSSEESGNLGMITNSFATVCSRYGHQLPNEGVKILKSIVLAAKMGLNATSKEDAVLALAELGGIKKDKAQGIILQLESENNIIAWDQSSRQFEILGDAISRTQFVADLKKRVASSYDERAISQLFLRKISDWCDLLGDQECDFAETHEITTKEWRFLGVNSNLEVLPASLLDAAQRWYDAIDVDKERGTIIYCYVEPSCDLETVEADVIKMLTDTAKLKKVNSLPLLIVLLSDNGQLANVIAELAVIEEGFNEQDKLKYGNLIGAYREKSLNIIRTQIDKMIKDRRYITSFDEPMQPQRLGQVCSQVFEKIYTKPLAFPFDGFSTAKGNAADTCLQLTTDLLRGALDYQAVMAKPTKDKNRAVRVLKESWQVFSKDGTISRKPSNSVVKSIINEWEDKLKTGTNRLNLADAIKKVCLPQYGANIASAGLLFGVFLVSRIEDLTIMRDGQSIDITKLLNDGIFRGKYLDLAKLSHVDLIKSGSESSAWKQMLDEWEQATYYEDRLDCYHRALNLKERISIPHALNYKFEHLKDMAEDAFKKIEDKDKKVEEALEKIENGYQKRDAGSVSWGGSAIKGIQEKMQTDASWRPEEVSGLDKEIEYARQAIIQTFPQWLSSKVPRNDTPTEIGNYQHTMLRVIGNNLNKLGLTAEYEQLQQHVSKAVQNANTIAEANQLIRDSESYIIAHSDVDRLLRMAEIRGQLDVAKEFTNKLIGMAKRVNLSEISTARTKLSEYTEKLHARDKLIKKRAEKMWSSTISQDTLDQLLLEVNDLEHIFEGCESDIEDFRVMRRALQMYQDCYHQLFVETLNDNEFEKLAGKLRKNAIKEFDEDKPPWPPEETIDEILDEAKISRIAKGNEWMKAIELSVKGLEKMDVREVNLLREKATNSPAYLNDKQKELLKQHLKQIDNHLISIEVEWLVEKYSHLNNKAKDDFLKRIGIKKN